MLSAEEARQELEKDVLERLPQKQKEEIEVYLALFAADLERMLSLNIESAIVRGKENVTFRMRFERRLHYYGVTDDFPTHWDIFDSLGVFPRGDLRRVYIEKTQIAIEEQVQDLIELGYNASCQFNIHDEVDNMSIDISWGKEKECHTDSSTHTPDKVGSKEHIEKKKICMTSNPENEHWAKNWTKRWLGK